MLAARTGIGVTEIDAIFHGPGWSETPDDEMLETLGRLAACDEWIVDGNYTKFTEQTLWPRAQLVVWLDLSKALVIARVVRRTIRRIVMRERLWNGNRETLRAAFSHESIVRWAWTTHEANRAKYPRLAASYPHAQLIRLQSRKEVRGFVETIQRGVGQSAEGTKRTDGLRDQERQAGPVNALH